MTRDQLTLLDMIGIVASGFAIVACVALLFVIPTFTTMYQDFTVALPVLTVLVIYRWPIVLAVLVSGGLLVAGGIGFGASLLVRRLLMLGSFSIALLTVMLTVVALYLPIVEMSSVITADAPGSSLQVELPRAAPELDLAVPLTLTIDRDGSFYLNAVPMDREGLRAELSARAHENPDARLIVVADRDARYATVVELMHLANACGIPNLAIAPEVSEPVPEPEPQQ